jgi:hypothetical protein
MKVFMTKATMIIFSVLSLVVFGMSTAVANTTTTFSDNAFYWAGWGNLEDDTTDSIGGPEFFGGEYTINSYGNLTSMSFNYGVHQDIMQIGDLFVDKDNDSNWDYVLSKTSSTEGKIYDIQLGISPTGTNSGLYRTSNEYFAGSGMNYRQDHAVEINTTSLTSTLDFDLNDYNSNTASPIVFSGFELALGQDFAFGFTMNCANDVIFETGTNPVPIPTSIFLLGAGLTGLAGIRRKQK